MLVVGARCDMREQTADRDPALAVLLELPRRFHQWPEIAGLQISDVERHEKRLLSVE